ncbi:pyridoxal phosphate-dependent aminotransferase [Pseudemcibacter aquimaris]|uniref:pyridoxal phosphate-dependent aminotransferase n=1 Tax=Pseudemcibacter aquimaris TaxID=2857064 RepID=UPI0020133A1E|nr:aminotransferase class I/II-fold pyridoxal phosphate-dependent enzyme [Pseudemcibacter aquimaris]MCC3859597.1 aminotransferase class I/II-fold pyridoxal phosphate-dependent enzyme [Pseudemcibacter aquimaris]WDU59993.1 aminotransferase class I/II-fold pyridoxal phosphate-dependent enzyme [Pseudemcibacter aquimaris]
MSRNDLSTLTNRISGPASRAWDVGDEAARRILKGEDIIHLGVGDPDLDTPKDVRVALEQAVEAGKTHYAPIPGEYALREAIAEHATWLYGNKVNAESVIVANGAQGALFATFQCIVEKGDEVIVLEPYYATYPAVVTAGGATMVSVQLDLEEDYKLDIEKIKAAVTKNTKAIIVNSPSNPAGAVIDRDAVLDIAKYCHENNIWLISDEVYWSHCYEDDHISAYAHEEYRDRIIVINSLSKSHAMTGWRMGWAIGPDHFIDAMTNYSQAAQFGINQFVQNAAITALKDKSTTETFRALFKSRRDAFCDGLRASNHLKFSKARGGMFVLLDISATGLSGKEFAEKLLDDENVAVVPGFGFGENMAHTVRIGYLCDEENLREAAKRIVRFTEKFIR